MRRYRLLFTSFTLLPSYILDMHTRLKKTLFRCWYRIHTLDFKPRLLMFCFQLSRNLNTTYGGCSKFALGQLKECRRKELCLLLFLNFILHVLLGMQFQIIGILFLQRFWFPTVFMNFCHYHTEFSSVCASISLQLNLSIFFRTCTVYSLDLLCSSATITRMAELLTQV